MCFYPPKIPDQNEWPKSHIYRLKDWSFGRVEGAIRTNSCRCNGLMTRGQHLENLASIYCAVLTF
jgi:hypothetical protein